ncbi:MAG TPA: glycoside hydrolase family 3 N-terminal domain-containing protein [Gammaproteobacteria bacterium]|nr:glycoside hydrolase family 3 N-terminal domain-containing protein [Gammaproteobacteria bacterium]
MRQMLRAPAAAGVGVILVLAAACAHGASKPERHLGAAAWPEAAGPVRDSAEETARIEALLERMTLEEKVGQIMQAEINEITPDEARRYHIGSILNGGGSTPGKIRNARPGDWLALADAFYKASVTPDGGVAIPVIWGTDAMHGHSNVTGATLFPHNIALGAAADPELIRQIGEATAREVRATGIDWVFAPTVAVVQNDRWGRTYESYSENPALVQTLASAMVEGLQGKPGTPQFLDREHVVATAKHFLADGGTFGGDDQGDARIIERELIDIHSPGYPAAIKAGVQTVMASYSSWNGRKMHDNGYLLTDVLKGRMGFDGLVVGDWNGHGQVPGCTNANCAAAINAGIDLIMVPQDWKALIQNTLAQVRAEEISISRLNDAVRRVLRVKMRAGLFDGISPSQRAGSLKNSAIGNAMHRALARQAVRETLVLLKNRNGILPLLPGQTVLVAGAGADHLGMQAGGWSVTWQGIDNTNQDFPGATSIYKGIRDTVESAGGKAILAVDGEYAGRADVAIVVFGEFPYAEGLGDVPTLEFEPRHKTSLALLKKLQSRKIPVVSVFLSGRPLWVNPELNASDAFVAAWQPGTEGAGVADVLFADGQGKPRYDFKGKLSFSWPKTPLQEKLNPHHPAYDPLFPLGYGLNYAAGAQGPGKLAENVPGIAKEEAETPFYVEGRLLQPWIISFKNQGKGNQLLSGEVGMLPTEDVSVRLSDKDGHNDAVTLSWRNAQLARVSLEQGGNASNLAQYQPEGVLSFDLKINKPLSDGLSVGIKFGIPKCEAECERHLPLSQQADAKWHKVVLKVSCFLKPGDNFERISIPFLLDSKGTGEVSIANVRWIKSAKGNTDCPD